MAHISSKDRLIARLKDALAAAQAQNQKSQQAVQAHLDKQADGNDEAREPADTSS